jgi:hypothetical protein
MRKKLTYYTSRYHFRRNGLQCLTKTAVQGIFGTSCLLVLPFTYRFRIRGRKRATFRPIAMDHDGSRRGLPKIPKKKQKARRKSTRNHKQPRNITASSGKDQTLSRSDKIPSSNVMIPSNNNDTRIPSNNINDRALSSNNRILSGNNRILTSDNRILISNNKVLFSNSSNSSTSSTSKSNPHMLILTPCPE